jgi:HlyD family secretion protein
MAGGSSVELLRDIQTLFDSGTAAGLTDRQLLERFIRQGDPAAFEVLVLRHGPMVLRVCRNLLHDPNDAQDAFQATFLVLVRRSGSIRRLDSVGSWLYGVACRAAARIRVGSARRRVVEERAASRVVEALEPADDESDRDAFGPIVQEEVRRLPERYRTVVVLCFWEGLTHEQAAAQLGCPLGTVRSRIARARDLLRRRLTRRGLAPSAVGIGSIGKLPPPAAELVQSTVRAAVWLAAGQGASPAVSAAVVSLVQGIIWRTTMIKLGGIAAGAILLGLVGFGAGFAAQRPDEADASRRAGVEERRPADGPAGPGQAEPKPARDAAGPPRDGRGSARHTVRSDVDGAATLVRIGVNGAFVKRGEVVCMLETEAFSNQLVDQRIAVKKAESAYVNAKSDREVAEIALKAYTDGESLGQLADAEGDIEIARAEMDLAEAELNNARAAHPDSRGVAIRRAEVAVLRTRFALEKAQSRKKVLTQYTRPKKVMELEAVVKKGRADELARMAIWELERSKEVKLEKQLDACTIRAPIDGQLRYDGRSISRGATIHGGQEIFEIEPAGPPEKADDRARPAAGKAAR